ncbi:hypothetical protein ACT3CE_07890 [Marinifilum sp. RC60d5]|uniref:hypothetical protein n=1 Tax=Marinifilum sp. RC60d5 TaxID=3458414 RepID=UPI004036161E
MRTSQLFIFVCCLFFALKGYTQTYKKLAIGDSFPNIKGKLLSSKEISIPEHCKGKVSVLIVAFKRETQDQVNTWTQPLLQEFGMHKDFRFIEIPMISSLFNWMSGYIDNGMRKGIASAMHKNVMTYYGPLNSYYRYFDVEDKKLCYLFLLDKNGTIQFIDKGEAQKQNLHLLTNKIKELIGS